MTTKLDIWNASIGLIEKWYDEIQKARSEGKNFKIDRPKKELAELLSKLTPDSTPEELYKDSVNFTNERGSDLIFWSDPASSISLDIMNEFFSLGISLSNIISIDKTCPKIKFLYGLISAEQCLDEMLAGKNGSDYKDVKKLRKDIKNGIVFGVGE